MKKTKIILLLMIFILMLNLASCNTTIEKNNLLKVYFFDVGQGDSTYIETKTGENILIDAGDNHYGNTVVSYLNSLNVKKIDYLIATHPDADHIGGLDDVLYNFEVKNIYAPKVNHTTKTFEDFLLAAKSKNLKIKEAKAGISLDIPDIDAKFIGPVTNYKKDLNSWSAVLKIGYGKTNFLFMGDATIKSECDIIKSRVNLQSNVLKLGHHGSNTSSSDEFLNLVKPEIGVISVGENNKYNHPNDEVLESLLHKNIEIHRTDQEGNILIESDGDEIFSKSINLENNKYTNMKVNLSNYNPSQNETIYLSIEGISNKDFKAIIHYKSKDSIYKGNTNLPMSINIGRPTKNFPIIIDLEIYDKKNIIRESITFTPK